MDFTNNPEDSLFKQDLHFSLFFICTNQCGHSVVEVVMELSCCVITGNIEAADIYTLRVIELRS